MSVGREPSETTKIIAFLVMCVGYFIALLDIQVVSSSLREIGGGLSAGTDQTAWVQTSYLIAEIIVVPLAGLMSRVISTRWLFCISAAGFTFSSMLCGNAWSIQSMIAFRALQGFLGGSMIPLVFTTAFIYFKGERLLVAAGILGAIASLAPTFGPSIGGWITENYTWHWLFFVNLVPGFFVALLIPILVKIDRPNLSLLRDVDYLGVVFMALFLGCLEYTLEDGPRWGWLDDETIRATAWISGINGILFIWRCLVVPNPVLDLRVFGGRNFGLGCFFSFVLGVGIFSTVYLTPLFLNEVRSFNSLQIGIAVLTTGLFQIAAIPFFLLGARHIDMRLMMTFGFICFTVSIFDFTHITHDWGGRQLLIPEALMGIGQQFAVAPTITLTLFGLTSAKLQQASGLINLLRNLGGAIGIAICGTIINNRTNLHFERLAEHLTNANPAAVSMLQNMTALEASGMGGDTNHGHLAALETLWGMTLEEAQTLAFSDAFMVICMAFVIAIALIPFMRKVTAKKLLWMETH